MTEGTRNNNAEPATSEAEANGQLDALLSRIQELTTAQPASDLLTGSAGSAYSGDEVKESDPPAPADQSLDSENSFAAMEGSVEGPVWDDDSQPWMPIEPETLSAGGLNEGEVEALILKCLNAHAESTGRVLAEQLHLPFRILDTLMQSMKHDRLVAYKGGASMNDYLYQLTELGRERAKKLAEYCTYFGAAPVTLNDYITSVQKQTLVNKHPTEDDLLRAFEDLLIDQRMLLRLGPAINSGRGLFLYGFPGNGKTSIAERITKAFGDSIWIPRALGINGEIVRLYDPGLHEEMPLAASEGLLDQRKIDNRWVRIRRPTIVVGGELTMSSLEITINTDTNVSEAPLQLKSNCGTLVIDDFGRQRMSTDELLNRWIVPLEKRYDFLSMASGKKIQVPFDQLIIFSTNLEPRDLVDEAFLRRIPYKIEVVDPEESMFRELVKIMAPILGVKYEESAVDYLVETHYRAVDRPFRFCQPRDLLLQIRNYCRYTDQPPVMKPEYFDYAVENYFAIM